MNATFGTESEREHSRGRDPLGPETGADKPAEILSRQRSKVKVLAGLCCWSNNKQHKIKQHKTVLLLSVSKILKKKPVVLLSVSGLLLTQIQRPELRKKF